MLYYRGCRLINNRLIWGSNSSSAISSISNLRILSRSNNWAIIRLCLWTSYTVLSFTKCKWSSFSMTKFNCLSNLLSKTNWSWFWFRSLTTFSTAYINSFARIFFVCSSHCHWPSIILCFKHWIEICSWFCFLLICRKGLSIKCINISIERFNFFPSFAGQLL